MDAETLTVFVGMGLTALILIGLGLRDRRRSARRAQDQR